jgi:hypothetical protein
MTQHETPKMPAKTPLFLEFIDFLS